VYKSLKINDPKSFDSEPLSSLMPSNVESLEAFQKHIDDLVIEVIRLIETWSGKLIEGIIDRMY